MKIKLSCFRCGCDFERESAEVKRRNPNGHKRHFCSTRCMALWQAENHSFNFRGAKQHRICPKCGREFWDYGNTRRKFCSRNCYKKGTTQHIGGYILTYAPNHPHAQHGGFVFQHRLVMEEQLGRYLDKKEVIHHINGNVTDNRIENLQLFSDNAKHLATHRKVPARFCSLAGEWLKQSPTGNNPAERGEKMKIVTEGE